MKEGVLGLQLCFKKKTLARVFSCQFCDIFKSTFFYETSGGSFFEDEESDSEKYPSLESDAED